MSLKRISSVNKQELISNTIRGFYLWPLAPSGTLIKPSHKYDVSEDSKQNIRDFERSIEHVDKFFQSKSTIMLWYMAIIIGILGNLFATIIFIESIQLRNVLFSLIFIAIIIIMTFIGIQYMPKYSLRYTIVGDYLDFPEGYEQYINIEEINNPIMKIHISMNFMHDIVRNYGIFIRRCIIKDTLTHTLKKVKYIKVDKIGILSEYLPSFDILFSTNLYALLRPRNQEEIFNEFMAVNGAILNAKMNSGVYAFELSENAWQKNGAFFLNEIAHIERDLYNKSNFIELNNQIAAEIKNSTKSAFRRDLIRISRKRVESSINYVRKKVSNF